MSGTSGYEAKPVQTFGFENAVLAVANTPFAQPGAGILVSCTVAGTIVLVTRGGQTVTLNMAVGLQLIPLGCTQMSNGGTFTGSAFNVY